MAFKKLSPRNATFLSLITLAIVLLADYATGRLAFGLIYFLPIGIAAWFSGKKSGVAVCLLAVVLWFLFPYRLFLFHGWASACWDGALRTGVFLCYSLLLSGLKTSNNRLKEAAADLEKQAQHIRATFDNAGVGIMEADQHDCLLAANPKACQILGRSSEQLKSMKVHELTWPEDRPLSDRLNRELHAGVRDLIDYEKRYIRGDGAPVWVHTTISAIRDAGRRWIRSIATMEDISDRKQAEDALRKTEERLCFVVDSGKVGYWDFDIMNNRVESSQLSTHLLGIPELMDFEGFLAAVHPEDRERTDIAVRRCLDRPGNNYDIEFRTQWPDGTVRWLQAKGSAMFESGKPVRMAGIVLDITDRKQAEEALRESEDRFRGTFENAAVGICHYDLDGRWLRVNQSLCEMVCYSREELLGHQFEDFTHPDDRDIDKKQYPLLISGRIGRYKTEKRCIRKDGSQIWVLVTRSMQCDASGKPLYCISVVQDISARKQVEEALHESEHRFREIAEGLPIPIWKCTPDLNCDYFNKSWLEFTGRTMDEELGLGWAEGVHPDDRQYCLDVFTQAANRREAFELEYRLRHHTGNYHWIFDRGVPRFAANGTFLGYLGSCLDISDRKRAQEQLAAAKQTAEQANQAKDHFLAVLSHELRTPLTPVVMGISMLQEKCDFDQEMTETLEMVRRNVEMEARLIDDLLDVTRITRGKIELNRSPVDIRLIIQRAIEVCRQDIEARRLHFDVDFGPAAPYWVDADVSRLQQVFWNLLKNAIKFTPHGGCVGIRCRPDEEHVICEVNDSGIGIEREALNRIFNAFEQAEQSHKRQFGGLGLGLAIGKALVEMHGGKIEARSDGRGKGATFRIRLPLSTAVGQIQFARDTAPAVHVVTPLSILLVEDHGVTAQMIQMVLTEKGHKVEVAGDVSTALELTDKHTFDVLLSDLGLPDGSGHDLMSELRTRGHKFPAIALSGYGQEDDIHRSYQAGFAAHLIKPASREAVLEAVASVAAGNGHPKSNMATTDQADAPVFDADEALKRCSGKREMFEAMVNSFQEEFPVLLRRMHAALPRGEIAETGRAAHRLKGTVFYLGAQPAANAARQVEQAARSGDPTAVAQAIAKLERQIELLRQALAA